MKAKKQSKKEEGKMPTHNDVPHIRPSKKTIEKLEEEDKLLWDKKRLEKNNKQFQDEANFLKRLMKKFRKI